MNNQELDYLRDEMNQRVNFHYNHADKTVNIILLVWGGALFIYGNARPTIASINDNILLYFIVTTIFFISNLILYFTARKYHDNADSTFRLGAYIAVFYEKRPSKTVKVGNNFSWELANFEKSIKDIGKKVKQRRNMDYSILSLISVVLIGLIIVDLFTIIYTGKDTKPNIKGWVMFFICVTYFVCSICLLCKIPSYTFRRDNIGMRALYYNEFIQYSLYTGHYTQDELNIRLGAEILNFIKEQNEKKTD